MVVKIVERKLRKVLDYGSLIWYNTLMDKIVDDREIKKAVVYEEEIRNSFEWAIESGELHGRISALVKSWESENKENFPKTS